MHRRRALHVAASAALAACPGLLRAQAPATLAVPGPRNSVSMPLELALALGLDREVGLPLRLSFVGGGGVAIQELRARNAEFAVFGLPAMVLANLSGGARLLALAAIDDLPLYTLVVRTDLRDAVRGVRDLAGRTLGVHSNSLQSKTTSHQLAEYLLRRHGVPLDGVKVIAAGQSWETQSSMLLTRTVDASLCDEPFATRMEAEGLGFKLFSTGNPADVATTPGSGFLRAVLVALQERVDASPQRAERAVRLVQRALAWIHGHSAEQFADALGLQGAERRAAIAVAATYPRQYSRDGSFSSRQLAETELFFKAGNPGLGPLPALRIGDMVIDRWAGRQP